MLTKTIDMLELRLEEATLLKNQCFAYQNLKGHSYWWETIVFLESMISLYVGDYE